MDLISYSKVIEHFLRDKKNETKVDGYVLGLSGGIDSALVSLLAINSVGKENVLHVLMPIKSHSNEENNSNSIYNKDVSDALELCKKFDLKYVIVDLTESFEAMKKVLNLKDNLSIANLKVRLRMVTLYALAQENKALVLGTDNLDERYTGYFTKYGDGACDLLPIASLLKREVFELSRFLGCPECILKRKPSASLWDDQTDESEMGVSYDDLDDFLIGKKEHLEQKVIDRIEHLHKVSNHKRESIPEAPKFIRD